MYLNVNKYIYIYIFKNIEIKIEIEIETQVRMDVDFSGIHELGLYRLVRECNGRLRVDVYPRLPRVWQYHMTRTSCSVEVTICKRFFRC